MRVRAARLDGHDDFLGNARELLGHAVPARKHRVLSDFEDASHGREFWQMTAEVAMRRAHLVARFDASSVATLSDLEPLRYAPAVELGLPGHVRAASALRRFAKRLVIVQDDVNALAVSDSTGALRPVLLPPHASGRVFDEAHWNKRDKLDLEACVSLDEHTLVALGSGSTPARERLVVWNGLDAPVVVDGASLYRDLRDAVTRGATRLNIEGAVVTRKLVKLFHRGN